MEAYSIFADVYDGFMTDIPYEDWADKISGCLARYGIKDGKLLELGCGTGSFTLLMAKRGFSVTGVDSSPKMLARARRKLLKSGFDITLLQQDMRALETDFFCRAVISVCDSMNYLRDEFDLESVFDGAAGALESGGIFIFDMKTPEFYGKLGNSVYTDENGEGRYVWENDYDPETGDNTYYITFYLKSVFGLYRKYTEEHIQHAFKGAEIKKAADAKGFRVAEVLDADMKSPARGNGDRIYYILEKI